MSCQLATLTTSDSAQPLFPHAHTVIYNRRKGHGQEHGKLSSRRLEANYTSQRTPETGTRIKNSAVGEMEMFRYQGDCSKGKCLKGNKEETILYSVIYNRRRSLFLIVMTGKLAIGNTSLVSQ